jgi:hypothetical protein
MGGGKKKADCQSFSYGIWSFPTVLFQTTVQIPRFLEV